MENIGYENMFEKLAGHEILPDLVHPGGTKRITLKLNLVKGE